MINKQKVSEILADMQEAERKKQEAIQKEVDDFLEGRLEYYVAMVMNRDINHPYDFESRLHVDGFRGNHKVAISKIEESLKTYDFYICYHGSSENIDRSYKDIRKVDPRLAQSVDVEKRQIELGLRPNPIEVMKRREQWRKEEMEREREFQKAKMEIFRCKEEPLSYYFKIFAWAVLVAVVLAFIAAALCHH